MKISKLAAFAVLLNVIIPGGYVSAHATPTEYIPAPSIVLERLPEKVAINFSERIEEAASSIIIFGPDGAQLPLDKASVRPDDLRYFEVPMPAGSEGTYAVSWQVVSADDGHFTKGAFTFSLGSEGGINLLNQREQLQVMHASPLSESLAIGIELVGHALFFGVFGALVLWHREMRLPLASNPEARRFFRRRIAALAILATACVVLGGTGYVIAKSISLQAIQAVEFADSLRSFLATAAGKYALYRILGVLVLLGLFWRKRMAIFAAEQLTAWEVIMGMLLLAQVVLRVQSSHAMAAHFLPWFTQLDHVIHLLAKNLWAGLLLIAAMLLWPTSRILGSVRFFDEHMRKIKAWLSAAIGLALITGTYIIWLDLKEFENLLLTDWGKNFILFGLLLIPLVGLRVYHLLFAEKEVQSKYGITFPLEVFFSITLLFGTAASMITTPPLARPALFDAISASGTDRLIFSEHPYEKNSYWIRGEDAGGNPIPLTRAVVTLFQEDEGIGPIVAEVERRTNSSFVFSKRELSPPGRWRVEVAASRERAYDLTGTYFIRHPASDVSGASRTRDVFGAVMIFGGIASLLVGLAMVKLAQKSMTAGESVSENTPPRFRIFLPVFLAALYIAGAWTVRTDILISPFERLCRSRGDMWHTMTAMREGRITSERAYAGCMTADGQYHFPNVLEYIHFTRPRNPSFSGEVVPPVPSAGVASSIVIEIKDEKGKPVDELTVAHERLLHVVVVSEDFKHFDHIHLEDFGTILPETRQSGRFTLPYIFPRSGRYLIAVDYRIQSSYISDHFVINVEGGPGMDEIRHDYKSVQEGDEYAVTLTASVPRAGEESVLEYYFNNKEGPIDALEAYLGAAMHISVVKEDFERFIHAHGEIHLEEEEKLSKGPHMHQALPHYFGPEVEAHISFPEPGIYHIFGQFKYRGKVELSHFMLEIPF